MDKGGRIREMLKIDCFILGILRMELKGKICNFSYVKQKCSQVELERDG